MTPPVNQTLLILKEACQKKGFNWKITDDYSNGLVEVSNGKDSFFASGSKPGFYPINLQFISQIAKDKAWCYKVLSQKGYKIPKGDYFFLKPDYREWRGDGKEKEDAFIFAEKIGYPVFVKPNSSWAGTLAEIIHHPKELEDHLEEIAKISFIALVQEVFEEAEYRIFAVDGEIEFAYRRSHGKIKGDGKKTIGELIEETNSTVKGERNKLTENSLYLKKQLEANQMSFSSVLEKGEELKVAAKSNLAAGGVIEDYTEEFSEKTKEWVKKLMSDIPLRVCGIDVFVKKSIDEPEGFTIIELNHNPNLAGIYNLGKKEKALSIFTKVMDRYFSKN